MINKLDGRLAVPTKDETLNVYLNLLGGRVTTKNATGFDPASLKVR